MADNIQVVVRTRPLLDRELKTGSPLMWKTSAGNTIQSTANSTKQYSFTFDTVFSPENETSDVYKKIEPIIHSAMNGINGTIFAYGQTASGKTHTMMGNPQEPGIIQLAIEQIYEHIENVFDREFLIRVSYMELYNENVVDLLGDGKTHLDIREGVDGKIFVERLSESVVSVKGEILDLIARGEARRHFGVTNMNERSSRSHTIFQVTIESKQLEDRENNHVNVSTLNLVDLAGSEKAKQTGAVGQRLQEGGYINKSLSALSKVISQLSDTSSQNRHVSYRDSKLTRILQNSLGGNSKTAIICNCTPASLEETLSTLRFAMSAKRITNKPVVNEVLSNEAMIMRYKVQINHLQKQLQQIKGTDVGYVQEENQELQQRLQQEERVRQDQTEQIDRLTKLICVSSRLKPSGETPDFKAKAKRRETWCPGGGRNKGGLGGLKMLSLSPVFDNEAENTSVSSVRFSARTSDFPRRRSGPAQETIAEEESGEESFEFSEVQLLRDELGTTQAALRDAQNVMQQTQQQLETQAAKHQKERCELKEALAHAHAEYQELQEYHSIERELKDMSMAEKRMNTSLFSPVRSSDGSALEETRVKLEKAESALARDRHDAEVMMQDLLKELALEKDHKALVQAEMDEMKKSLARLEAERGDFDLLMEMEKNKFTRRENELKDQLERAYADSGVRPTPTPSRTPGDTVAETKLQELQGTCDSLKKELAEKSEVIEKYEIQQNTLELLRNQVQSLETALAGKSEQMSALERQAASAQEMAADIQRLKCEIKDVSKNTDVDVEDPTETDILKEQIESLKKELSERNTESSEEQAALIEQLRDEIHSLKEARDNAGTENHEGSEQSVLMIEQLRDQVQSLQAQLTLVSEPEMSGMCIADELAELTTGLTDMFPRKSLALTPKQTGGAVRAARHEGALRELEARNTELTELNQQLQEELKSAKEELSAAQEKLDATQTEIASLKAEMTSATSTMTSSEHTSPSNELTSALAELESTKQELASTQEELSDAEHILVRKESELADLENKVAELESKLENKEAEYGQVEAKVQTKEDEMGQLEVKLESTVSQLDSREAEIGQLTTKLETRDTEISQLEARMAELGQQENKTDPMESKESDGGELQAKMAELQTQVNELEEKEKKMTVQHEDKVKELDSEIQELLCAMQEMRSEEDRLNTERKEMRDIIDGFVLDTKTQAEEVTRLQEVIEQEKDMHQEQIKEFENLIEKYSESEKEWRIQEENLQQIVDGKSKREAELIDQNSQFQDRLEEYEKEKIELVNQITQVKVICEGLTNNEDDSISRQRVLQNEIEILKQSLAEKEHDSFTRITALSNDLDDLQSENIELVATQQRLGEQIATLETERGELESRIAELSQQIKDQERCTEEALLERDSRQAEVERLKAIADSSTDRDHQVHELSETVTRVSAESEQSARALSALQSEHAHTSEQLTHAQQQIQELHETIGKGRKMLERCQEDNDELAEQCTELEQLNTQISRERDEAMSELERVGDNQSSEVEQLKTLHAQQVEELEGKMASLQADIEASRERASRAETELESVQAELSARRCELNSLQTSACADTHELDTLRSKLMAANEDVASLKEQISEREREAQQDSEERWQQVRALQDSFLHAQEDLARWREQQKGVEGAGAQQVERQVAEQVHALREQCKQQYDQLLTYKADREGQVDESESAGALYVRLESLVQHVTQQSQTIAEEVPALRSRVVTLEKDLRELQEDSESEQNRLMTCCDESDAELEQMTRMRNELRTQLYKLKSQPSQQNSTSVLETTAVENTRIEELMKEKSELQSRVTSLEKELRELQEESESEQNRLMTCCDESDAELEAMTRMRNELRQQLDKLNKGGNTQLTAVQAEKERLEKLMREQQIEMVRLKNEVLMASDPYRKRIRELTKEVEVSKERETHLRNELRKSRNNSPDDSIMPTKSGPCYINGPAGVNAELLRCQMDAEKKRHEKELQWLSQENKTLKHSDQKQRDQIRELRRQVQEKDTQIQKFKEIYNKKLSANDRHVLRDMANSPAPSVRLGGMRTPRMKENNPPHHKKGLLSMTPTMNRTVCDEDFRVCTPPDPSAEIQCPQQ